VGGMERSAQFPTVSKLIFVASLLHCISLGGNEFEYFLKVSSVARVYLALLELNLTLCLVKVLIKLLNLYLSMCWVSPILIEFELTREGINR
jgi:hypothetical protein